MFTKTTLNKMKKAQVVEMYLALQAQQINNEMDMDIDYEQHIDELETQLANFRTNEKLREEKLQEQETNYEQHIDELETQLVNFRTNEKLREEKLQELTLENKELQEKVEGWEEAAGVMLTDNTKLTEQYNVVVGTSNKYAEEALELKEQIEKLEGDFEKLKTPEEVKRSFEDLSSSWFGDEEDWYRENFLDGMDDADPEDIPTKDLEDCNYKQLRVLWDWLIDGKYEA